MGSPSAGGEQNREPLKPGVRLTAKKSNTG